MASQTTVMSHKSLARSPVTFSLVLLTTHTPCVFNCTTPLFFSFAPSWWADATVISGDILAADVNFVLILDACGCLSKGAGETRPFSFIESLYEIWAG